jgi:cytoskeletal protein CcmA (bactofilin family)
MDKDHVRNLIIAGIGATNGGSVYLAKIDGTGTVTGDIECAVFTINGRAEMHGSVKANSAEINGTINVEGDLIAESIKLTGMAAIKGKCEAEKLYANGRLDIDTLNAGNIQITLHGSSSIAEIGGEHIEIRKQRGIALTKLLNALSIPPFDKLTARIIEGDDIYLEYTVAAVVRGTNVSIGPGCEIELVEYKKKLELHKSSKILRSVQI